MKKDRAICRLWEKRPNYKITSLIKQIDRTDAEKFLNNLPIKFKLNTLDESGSVPLLEVLVQGPMVEIFPPSGQEIYGIFFNQEGDGVEATPKIGFETIASAIEDCDTHQVSNEFTTINVKPIDIGCTRWVGLYDFQREHSAHEEVKVFIYKKPRRK